MERLKIQVIPHINTIKLSDEKPMQRVPRHPTFPKIIVIRVVYLG